MGVIAKGILRGCQGLFTPVSLRYPLSVFNKNSTLKGRQVLATSRIRGKDFGCLHRWVVIVQSNAHKNTLGRLIIEFCDIMSLRLGLPRIHQRLPDSFTYTFESPSRLNLLVAKT